MPKPRWTLALLVASAVAVAAAIGCEPNPGQGDASPDDRPEAAAGDAVEAPDATLAWEVPGARSGFVDTSDGERIHYVELRPSEDEGEAGGAGEASLLFVTGWMLPAQIWEPQLTHFGRAHRVVAVDPRAQGRSSKAREGLYAAARARDLREVVETLALEPVVLIGWSMGVTEVVAYVEQYGTDGVAGLVLVDGLAGFDLQAELARQFLDWGAAYVHERRATTEAFVRSMFRSPRTDEYLARLEEEALRTPTDAAVALAVGQARSDHRAALSRIDRPTLIAIAPGGMWTEQYEAMRDSIPGARLERFEGAGHALFVDQAERFNRALEEFLAGLER